MADEEFDTSDLAWSFYKLFYGINNEEKKDERGRSYIEIDFGNGPIKMSGDTDYNFGSGWSHTILGKYEGYLCTDESVAPPGCMKQLGICEKLYKSILNISLMPQTGNLQSTKKGIGNDRLDTFIWALNGYYIGETSLLFNYSTYENTSDLKKYLDLFRTGNKNEDIYNYCLRIYSIENQLADELIQNGKKAIDSDAEVINYMKLAYEFWCAKLRHTKEKMKEEKPLSKKKIEEIEIIKREIEKVEVELDELGRLFEV